MNRYASQGIVLQIKNTLIFQNPELLVMYAFNTYSLKEWKNTLSLHLTCIKINFIDNKTMREKEAGKKGKKGKKKR